jgi:3-(3-hydroxy-phenyl)propionate hydroxylase
VNTGQEDFDVAIVGFGPVGAVAACWLGQMGIKTIVLEKSRSIWEIPRAMALDHEILRVFQNIGVIEQILPHTAPFGTSEHYGAGGQLIRRIGVVAPPHPMGYLPNMVFTQPPVEAALRQRAAQHKCVTIQLGAEVTGLAEEQDPVSISVLRDDGTSAEVRARYVIACDGASSTVRRLLQMPLEDLGFDEPWLVVDMLVNQSALAALPAECAQYCDPVRPYTYIIGPGNHRRWEIMLNPGEDPRVLEREENVWPLLARWLKPGDAKMWRASSYRFHALVARRWQRGPVCLAGDAAHQQPPFLGQGMCQGIRDASNLCWKLGAVIAGTCSDTLLDTYEQERKDHARTLIERIKEIGAAICLRNPAAARRRDKELLTRGGGKALVVTRQEIVPPLTSGLINKHCRGAGVSFPQPRIASAEGTVLLDRLSGHGWRLMVDGRTELKVPDLKHGEIKTVILGGSGFSETDHVAARWFDEHGCQAAIVRPDHYVYCGLDDIGSASLRWEELLQVISSGITAGPSGVNNPKLL